MTSVDMDRPRIKLSIVSTLYRSADTIEPFYERCMAAATGLCQDIELVLVNDGSPDDSLARALDLKDRDSRVIVVDLSRNFGHHKAMMTGLTVASGDYVFLIDSDLEEEPELLTTFWNRFHKGDCDVVYGVQEARRGGWFERVTGNTFFWLVDKLSDQKLPRNLVTARLMTRQYVRELIRHRDREFFIAHLWLLTGFRQEPLTVSKLTLSPTSYSVTKRVEMLVKYVTTTSTKLLYMILYLGLGTAVLSGAAVLYIVARYLWTGVAADGWASLIVAICFFGGLTTLILGILGIYIANIFSETKRRPYAVVRRIHRGPAAESRL
ncbi:MULTISPECIES: glycosyltransferase [unclassified Bosea (in: a-proteobacteria)]|uniref:glycosyltransferase n=1 Tax=unclassified Bosea (in: a-proteobacteria) TaxID=2653178 RepID=UPI001F19982D|nr:MULTISPECIES: glycosyltransferase [unclassified Bosea (in: a-proteobacteria)]